MNKSVSIEEEREAVIDDKVREKLVSIIIPSFNSAKTLKHTLPSILRQNRELIADIIVVDSSDDPSIQSLIDEFSPRGIRFINSGLRVMPARQRNIGAKEARGQLLLFLDSDVILDEGYVAQVADFYLKGHRAGFGSVKLADFQKRKVTVVAQYYLQLNEYLPAGKPRIKPFVLGCSNWVEREIFMKIGGYPEILAAEDVLYGFLLGKECDIWFFPQATVAHIFREDWSGYFRNQRHLGTYVARYRKRESRSFAFRGYMPILFFPVFFAIKASRILPRIIAAGPVHALKCLLVGPAFAVGLHHWCAGFVGELLRKED